LVLKDFVVKEATMRNRHLDIKVDVNDNASHSLLERIYEKLSYQKILANKMRLIEAINELHTQEPDLSFLASDLADLWSNRNRIDAEFKMQPQISERASIYLTKIMVAYHAAKGKTVNEARLEKLKQLIGNEHTVAELIATVMS
jgi:hypothetical protein